MTTHPTDGQEGEGDSDDGNEGNLNHLTSAELLTEQNVLVIERNRAVTEVNVDYLKKNSRYKKIKDKKRNWRDNENFIRSIPSLIRAQKQIHLPNKDSLGLGAAVVLNLLEKFSNKIGRYCLYFDNLTTSLQVQLFLRSCQIWDIKELDISGKIELKNILFLT